MEEATKLFNLRAVPVASRDDCEVIIIISIVIIVIVEVIISSDEKIRDSAASSTLWQEEESRFRIDSSTGAAIKRVCELSEKRFNRKRFSLSSFAVADERRN